MNDTQRFTLFRKDLLRWFAENRRPLPWRADYTPYRTWIAEVMMQQTQMDRGVQYFLRWMERFPDVAAVAAAHNQMRGQMPRERRGADGKGSATTAARATSRPPPG